MGTTGMTPKQLAERVAIQIGFGHWEEDLVTREIGTAETLAIAAERLAAIVQDASVGLKVVLSELAVSRSLRPSKNRARIRSRAERR